MLLAVGTGISLEVAGQDLVATAVRVRPGGIKVLGSTTIAGFEERPAAEWGAEYAAFLRQMGAGHLPATVLLRRTEVIVRQITFPGVAAKDLSSAVQFQIDSLHPYGEDEVRYTWARLGNTPAVLVGIARKVVVDGYSQMFIEAGVKVASFSFSAAVLYSALRMHGSPATGEFLAIGVDREVEVYGESPARPLFSAVFDLPPDKAAALAAAELRLPPETQPVQLSDILPKPKAAPADYDFSRGALAYATALAGACPWLALKANLLPLELRSSGSRMVFIPTVALTTALLVMAAALVAQSGFQQRRQLAMIEAEIKRLEPPANKAGTLRQATESARRRILLLDSFRQRTRADLEALDALSKLIEPPAWLQALEMDRDTVTLAGEIEQAAPLLKLLDNSPYFRDSEFTGPTGRAGKSETFRLRTAREGVKP
jgi:Tfp pilus assembly protein PilN